MGKDFTATITNPERAAEWEAILGTTTIHIKSPIPTPASLPGHPETLIYELDLNLITSEQRQRLIQYLASKFAIPPYIVEYELPIHGVPILADDCTVSVANPQKWF
jgi:hypothetical protein